MLTSPWNTESRFSFSAGGATLEGQCFGPPPEQAPTFILLHEGLGCLSLWRDFPDLLSKRTGWGVFAYSRQGYGASDPAILPRPINYMTDEARLSVPDMLNAIGLKRGILLGHSDGASIAALYAGTFKDARIDRIILMAPHFFAESISIEAISAAKDDYNQGNLKPRLAKYHADVEGAFRGWNDTWLHPDFLDWNIEAAIAGIETPVLVLQGEVDPYGTLAQVDALRRSLKPLLKAVILPDCGHAPHLEKTRDVLDAIDEFVQECR